MIEKAALIADRAVQARVQGIAARWRDAVPDAQVSETEGSVVVEARGLNRGWLAEPLLRFAGSMSR